MWSVRKIVQRGDIPGAIDAHLAIHRLFYEFAGHTLLLNCWRAWEAKLRLYLVIDHTLFTDVKTMIDSYRRLVKVVRGGDTAAIAEELRSHIEGSAHTIAAQEKKRGANERGA